MAGTLLLTTQQLQTEFQKLNQQTAQSLDSIRDRVDQKLVAMTDQVQLKLDQNIKEGFAQFEKVQQHLRAAEEQLREVGALGHSINDLNNLLKMPHLRGQFGEAMQGGLVLLGYTVGLHLGGDQAGPGGSDHGPDQVQVGAPVDRRGDPAGGPRHRGRAGQHEPGGRPGRRQPAAEALPGGIRAKSTLQMAFCSSELRFVL